MLLFLISFVGGVLTVLAPCILPLLPIIVGGSLSDGKINKKKAFTVVISLGVSVIAFTLLLKVSTLFINIPEYTWKLVSGGIILFLGIVTLFPSLWENQLLATLSTKSNILLGKGDKKKSFWGDVIVGAALGPVFSTCSPTYFIVIATVLPVKPLVGMLYLFVYTIGLCISLLLVTFLGQKIMSALNVASDPKSTLKRVLGVVFIIVGLAILTGFDKKAESAIIGSGFFDVTKVEQKLLEKNNAPTTTPATEIGSKQTKEYLTLAQKDLLYKKAPELSSIDGYINTDGKPITLASLKGKVVLLDIWTYSCINCQRTLPYINDWYGKYKDQGLEVVGLHTPEFGFEKVQANVEKAVQGFNITYPVVLDNDYSTWQALGNQYWPRKYLIDIDGYIVYDHIGEGNYKETEEAIQHALQEREDRMGIKETVSQTISKPRNAISFESEKIGSPEVYFGAARNEYLANGKRSASGEQAFTLPSDLSANSLYLDGIWNFTSESAENTSQASIVFPYKAKNVYVAAGSDAGVEVEIYKDDVFIKKVNITDEKLYPLIQDMDYGIHTLRIKIPKAGLKAFTFTFG
jgi:cytochrome c biogenesis protein CcdA/thiol-disulfide isomerase/thioredoxin